MRYRFMYVICTVFVTLLVQGSAVAFAYWLATVHVALMLAFAGFWIAASLLNYLKQLPQIVKTWREMRKLDYQTRERKEAKRLIRRAFMPAPEEMVRD